MKESRFSRSKSFKILIWQKKTGNAASEKDKPKIELMFLFQVRIFGCFVIYQLPAKQFAIKYLPSFSY